MVKWAPNKTHLKLPHGRNNWNALLYIENWFFVINRVEWKKGICHIWSRGRRFSPSLPGDRYLKLNSQKRPTGRNLGGNRLVRRSGTTSRGTALLAFCKRMRSSRKLKLLPFFWEKLSGNRICFKFQPKKVFENNRH